jgi:anti-sigma-K factor RskA
MSVPPEIEATEGLAVDYVLGELAEDDARAFEQRLDADPELAREVERLRAVLGLVPYAKAVEPPPHLRAAVLRAADQARKAKRVRIRPAWSTYGLAAAAVLALALGIDSYRLRRELRLQQTVTAMLQEPNIVLSFGLHGTGSGSGAIGTVKLDLDAKKGALAVEHLPALPSGQVYRLWALVAGKDVPCGDFGANAAGTIVSQFAVPVDSYVAPISKLYVTVEPTPPPPHPSGPTVMTSV